MNLKDARILITRPRGQSDGFAAALRRVGAIPILLPAIEIAPLQDTTGLDEALRHLDAFTWIVFTSVNGVKHTWERLAVLDIPSLPPGVRVAAIGPKTAAALEEKGIRPDFIPAEYIAEAILPGLGDLRGKRVLLLRADLARPALAQAIDAAGGEAHEIPVYHTLPASLDPQDLATMRDGIDAITFTSASTVHAFAHLLRENDMNPADLPGDPLIACIGPITAAAARDEGLRVDVVAERYTTDGLIEALQRNNTHAITNR